MKARRTTDKFYDRSPVGKQVESAITEFVESLRRRDRVESTLNYAATNLRTWFRWLAERSRNYLDVTPDDVVAYRKALASRYSSKNTVRFKTITLRTFYEHLKNKGKVETNPVSPNYVSRRTDDGSHTELLDAYAEHQKALHRAQGTIDGDRSDLRTFLSYLDGRGIQSVCDVTGDDIIVYRNELADSGRYALCTLFGKLTTVRNLYGYLVRMGEMERNPTELLPLDEKRRRLPRDVMSRKEAKALLEQPDTTTNGGVRDRTILEVFYSSGLRLAELIHLDVSDVDTSRCEVRVIEGKGAKDRRIPIGNSACFWVKLYRDTVRPRLVASTTEKALFVGVGGGRRINRGVLFRLVVSYGEKAGIRKSVFPHLLRHSFASHLVGNGCSTLYVQEMLGHEHLESTQVYTHVTVNELREAHEQFHPRD